MVLWWSVWGVEWTSVDWGHHDNTGLDSMVCRGGIMYTL